MVPGSAEQRLIRDDILRTMAQVDMHAYDLGSTEALNLLRTEVLESRNGASEVRDTWAHEGCSRKPCARAANVGPGATPEQQRPLQRASPAVQAPAAGRTISSHGPG